MLSKRVSEILNFQNLIFIFLSQNLEGEKIKTDFTKLNFFSQKQKPIRNFFFILTNRFDQIEIIFEQFRFWLVRGKLYFEKNLWKTYFFPIFWRLKKWFLNDFINDPERRITASRDFLIAAKITLKSESCDYSLVLKNHLKKFNLFFSRRNSQNRAFLGKKVWTKPLSGKTKMGGGEPKSCYRISFVAYTLMILLRLVR